MNKVRGRLVNFRVTDDEFEQLKLACDRFGERCLSAFARRVMLSAPPSAAEDYSVQMAAFDRRLSTLEISMSRLSNALHGASVGANSSKK